MTARIARLLALFAALISVLALPCSSYSKYRRTTTSGSNPEVLITDFKCMMGPADPSSAVPSVFSITGAAQNVGAEPLRDGELFVSGRTTHMHPSNEMIFTPEAQIFLPHQLDPGRSFSFQVSGTISISLPSKVKDGAYIGRVSMMVTVPMRGSIKFSANKDHGYQLDFPVYLNRRLRAGAAPAECNGTVLRRASIWGEGNWTNGKCYSISGVILRWVSPTQALLGPDKDNPLLVEFSEPPEARLGLNPAIAIDEGTYPYTNEFGVSMPIPRLKALKPVTAFIAVTEPGSAAQESSVAQRREDHDAQG